MNKKIFLIVVLSLMSNNLLYGEDSTEKIIRKNNSIFRMVDDKLRSGGRFQSRRAQKGQALLRPKFRCA